MEKETKKYRIVAKTTHYRGKEETLYYVHKYMRSWFGFGKYKWHELGVVDYGSYEYKTIEEAEERIREEKDWDNPPPINIRTIKEL